MRRRARVSAALVMDRIVVEAAQLSFRITPSRRPIATLTP